MPRDTNTQMQKKDKLLRRRLKEPLKVEERVLALAERLNFEIRKVVKTSKDNYLYWISKEGDDKIIDKHFLRQELFVLNDQFA